jgi:hypothetical protein
VRKHLIANEIIENRCSYGALMHLSSYIFIYGECRKDTSSFESFQILNHDWGNIGRGPAVSSIICEEKKHVSKALIEGLIEENYLFFHMQHFHLKTSIAQSFNLLIYAFIRLAELDFVEMIV